MNPFDLPGDDEQITYMLTEGETPPTMGVAYPNWHNEYPGLTDSLKEAFREGGVVAFREATMGVAYGVVETFLENHGHDRDPTHEEVLGTAVNTVATPRGTRSGFVRGAIAELKLEELLARRGATPVALERVLAEADDAPEIDDADDGRADDSLVKQGGRWAERKGLDVSVETFDGTLTHLQVKATTTRPATTSLNKADYLVWYKVSNGRMQEVKVYDPDTEEWAPIDSVRIDGH